MRPIPQTRIPGPAPAELNIAYRSSKTYWHVFKIGPEPVDVVIVTVILVVCSRSRYQRK